MPPPTGCAVTLALWCCLVASPGRPGLVPPGHGRRDLDVGIPPGAPIGWGQRFPVLTPRPAPLFPITPRADGRTRATPTPGFAAHGADSAGVVRVLTWDILDHMAWITDRYPGREAPRPGPGQLPRSGDALYWTATAAMLRVLLHPQLVSERATIAHLTELGEPVLAAVEAAAAENYLEELSRAVARRIAAPRRPPTPQPGVDARATMLKRLLAEELVRCHPYDPEGGFGARVFVFGAEMVPLLADYARHEDPFLARNATAALGRYDLPAATAALADLAATTADPVVLMRALAALGGKRRLPDPAPLLARLAKCTDPVETVALVDALGRCGARAAIAQLLELGESARRDRDGDLLQAVLAALARLRPAADDRAAERFRRRVQQDANGDPLQFAARRVNTAPDPDRVDDRELRGHIIAQLAALLHARTEPGDAAAANRVLALLSDRRAEPSARLTVGQYADFTLEQVYPPVRFLFLETLADLGRNGRAGLARVAADASAEPPLRAAALLLLPTGRRAPLLRDLFRDPHTPVEMKAYGLDLMARDGHAALQEIGLRLLEECARADAAAGTAQDRQLWLAAVRALAERGLADLDALLPLLRHVTAPMTRGDARGHVRREVGLLITAAAAGGLDQADLRARVDALLDVMVEHKVDGQVRTGSRDAARARIVGQLAGLADNPDDADYRQLVTNAVMTVLFGELRRQAEFTPVVLLEEEILLAIGRVGSAPAAAALAAFVRDHPASPHRPTAALALGLTARPEAGATLVRLLLGSDPFTRLCAYESLRHLTGREHWADWLHGAARDRTVAAEKYHRLVGR